MVFKQLIKEFVLPFIIAMCWAIYNMTEQNTIVWSSTLFIQSFGAAFFFISWLLAQYFRVRKQTKVDNNLQSIHQNISSVVDELKDATIKLMGYQIGGDSFCYLTLGSINNDSNSGLETVVHQGQYPLFDVSARIVDLDKMSIAVVDSLNMQELMGKNRSFGGLVPGFCKAGSVWNLGSGNQGKFNIFWVARNGGFTQLLRFIKIDGKWHSATRVDRENIVLFEQVSEGYPRNTQGEIDW